MAKNWKFGEAVRAIQAGNKEDIQDIGRRFPLFLHLASQVNDAGAALIDCVPDYCTARKIESVLKGDIQEAPEGDVEETEAEEAPAPKKAPAKAEKKTPAKKAAKKDEDAEEEDELESKTAKELFEMCKEAGLKVKPKQDKAVYIAALKEAEKEEEDDWDEEDEEPAPPKKAAKKAPAKKAPAKKDEDDEDDDWEV